MRRKRDGDPIAQTRKRAAHRRRERVSRGIARLDRNLLSAAEVRSVWRLHEPRGLQFDRAALVACK